MADESEMKSDLTLRKASMADYEFLYRLHKDALKPYIEKTWGWEEEWQIKHFREHFDPAIRKIIQVQGEDIGCISVQDQGDSLFIAYIAILPTYQRRGIGTYLIRNIIQEAEKRKIPIRIQTLKVNPARELYERLGFRITGSTETHYLMER
jgi:ribosomal protein S18 acetylase RimI-like enzyme